ncbi:MAG: LemA family protein [Verrucomicrobiota bacterium]
MSQDASGAGLIALLASGGCLLLALNAGRKRRLLDDTPISKALGVFVGEVEVEGVCVRRDPFISYLAEKPCVVYRWSVEEHWRRARQETYTDDKGRTRTRTVIDTGSDTVASGGETGGFYIQDDTGYVWVNPEGADMDTLTMFDRDVDESDPLYYDKGPSDAVEGSTGERSFTEHGLVIGTPLFVRGRASERPDIVAAQIKHEDKADMFIITTRKAHEVSEGKASAFVLWNVFGALLAGGFGAMLMAGARPEVAPFGLLLGVILYLIALGFGWVWMVFNSIVGLRNRVRQAQSLIDIQLKRRADLIPPLVACVQGFRAHEASVQTLVAALRSQASGARTSALAPMLIAVAERYPDLRAQESFDELRKNLVETEDRIALARAYCNNIATFYNTRLERVPDRYVADILKMQPEPLFQAEGFERQAQKIAF